MDYKNPIDSSIDILHLIYSCVLDGPKKRDDSSPSSTPKQKEHGGVPPEARWPFSPRDRWKRQHPTSLCLSTLCLYCLTLLCILFDLIRRHVVQPEDPVVDGRRASEASPHFFEVVIPEVVHCCRTPVSPGCDYLVLLINFWIQSETGMSPVT